MSSSLWGISRYPQAARTRIIVPGAMTEPHSEAQFCVLPMSEFRRLTNGERAEYLKRAADALKVIHDQLEEALANMMGSDRIRK